MGFTAVSTVADPLAREGCGNRAASGAIRTTAFAVTRAGARVLDEGGGGSIALVSSSAARTGLPNHEGYRRRQRPRGVSRYSRTRETRTLSRLSDQRPPVAL